MSHSAIFISYRRDDTADAAGRVYDKLTDHFGKFAVFKDVDSIPPGPEFATYIKDELAKCRIFLALIGPNWIAARDDLRRPRLDNPSDWVRVEIETALGTPDLQTIPVLVSGASLPTRDQLPESLMPLLDRNCAEVRRDPDFHHDMNRLIEALERRGLLPVDATVAPTTTAEFWRTLQSSEDVDEIKKFVLTFEGTPEAMYARRRLAQLSDVATVRESLDLVEARVAHVEQLRELGVFQGHEKVLARVQRACEAIDAFIGKWTTTEWNAEFVTARTNVSLVAARFSEELRAHNLRESYRSIGRDIVEAARPDFERARQAIERVDTTTAASELAGRAEEAMVLVDQFLETWPHAKPLWDELATARAKLEAILSD